MSVHSERISRFALSSRSFKAIRAFSSSTEAAASSWFSLVRGIQGFTGMVTLNPALTVSSRFQTKSFPARVPHDADRFSEGALAARFFCV